ncbi:MAG: SPASM domain-containing protein [Candidatus Jorgensenbacteria bacterium]|nr:SPASM domain-containing protein [Candidatus Jorgensenbacteria bacterium]
MEQEVFLVEDGSRTALFAPLHGLILEVNEKEKRAVAGLIERPEFAFTDLISVFPELEPERLLDPSAVSSGETTEEFAPTGVSLFTTFDCHLRCVYCYANAGLQKVSMGTVIADAAIDFIVANAVRKGSGECSLEFHGGGEPTRNWSLFQHALERFRRETKANNLTPKLGLATNGMLSSAQIEWITERFASVQVSLDGMEEIQNAQRPTAAQSGSFATVFNTVQALYARNIDLVLHVVVTERGVDRMPEIVRFFGEHFPKVTVHMEPASPCGRGLATGEQFPSPQRFVEGFLEGRKIAAAAGITLIYSGAGPQLAARNRSFCGVANPNFTVTPAGLVTACHEVAESVNPLAGCFIYGHFDQARGTFLFNEEKIARLRRFSRELDPVCSACFARFYCAGECVVKRMDSEGIFHSPHTNPRCAINRDLMRRYLFDQLFDGRKEECDEEECTEDRLSQRPS